MLLLKAHGRLRIYSDGAARGNPGPAAIAIKLLDEKGAVLKRVSKYLGRRTNNEAEYEALAAALESARGFTDDEVQCFLDSELVVKQLKGEYQVKRPKLESHWLKIRELQQHFRKVSFNHVPRTDKNVEEVDRMANHVLDAMLS
jgi:ribonuclease HI